MLVSDVSDTARWMAMYRAWESSRQDALFIDPFAQRLAGERGLAMTALAPKQVKSGWPLAVRTKLIDDLVLRVVEQGCDCVLNLAAGFDTRPYRLPVPPSLNWVEADLPAILAEKTAALAPWTPRCRLSRVGIDLKDARSRASLLDRISSESHKVFVLSEGFVVYLHEGEVSVIARDLSSRAALRWWIVDFFSPALLRMMQNGIGKGLDRAPLQFAPTNGVAFFESLGWRVEQTASIFREAVRLNRAPLAVRLAQLLPEPDPRRPGRSRWAPLVLLGNALA
jgi:methyltransferase (TIGR00027 family)